MKRSSIILMICFFLATGSLVVGYGLVGLWWIVPGILIVFLILAFARRYFPDRLASLFLFFYVVIAAAGVMLNAPVILMLAACVAALIVWDLLQFGQDAVGDSMGNKVILLESYHLRSLGQAAAAGVFFSSLGAVFRFQLPFLPVAILALTAVFSWSYGMYYLAGRKR